MSAPASSSASPAAASFNVVSAVAIVFSIGAAVLFVAAAREGAAPGPRVTTTSTRQIAPAGGQSVTVRCATQGIRGTRTGENQCPRGSAIGVRVDAEDAAAALRGSDGVLRPLQPQGLGRFVARVDVEPGAYEVVVLVGGGLAQLQAAVRDKSPHVLVVPLQITPGEDARSPSSTNAPGAAPGALPAGHP